MLDVLNTDWASPLLLEQKVQKIIAEQERYGWLFDMESAVLLEQEILGEIKKIDEQLSPLLPPKRIKIEKPEVDSPFRKDGQLADRVSKWLAMPPVGPFSKVDWEPFNLNSVAQVKDFLLTIGWEPDEWNYNDDGERSSPKLTESSLDGVEHPLGKHIAKREVLCHRQGLVTGLIAAVRDDGRIPSKINTIGAATHRGTHSVIANFPKAKDKVLYGKAIRSLMIVPEGYAQVGCDAKGLQSRCLAHYVNDPEFTHATINGDLHSDNLLVCQDLVPDRDVMKNVLYALN